MAEQKWSCGCFEQDGKLVTECTQTAPSGEISAQSHAVAKPFARKCARLAHAEDARRATQAEADKKAAQEKAAADLQTSEAEVAEKTDTDAAIFGHFPASRLRHDSQS
jgi:hypothetical protein